jgi:hypothetical protein
MPPAFVNTEVNDRVVVEVPKFGGSALDEVVDLDSRLPGVVVDPLSHLLRGFLKENRVFYQIPPSDPKDPTTWGHTEVRVDHYDGTLVCLYDSLPVRAAPFTLTLVHTNGLEVNYNLRGDGRNVRLKIDPPPRGFDAAALTSAQCLEVYDHIIRHVPYNVFPLSAPAVNFALQVLSRVSDNDHLLRAYVQRAPSHIRPSAEATHQVQLVGSSLQTYMFARAPPVPF